jgi:hypothetical protein
VIRAGTVVEPIAGAVDLYPTLIDLAGVARAGERPFDGISLAGWLRGEDPPVPERVLFQHWAGKVSARNQRYRLDAQGRLFDLVDDPGQRRDVSAEQPDIATALAADVEDWKRDVLAEITSPDARPYPVGYAELPRTVLPARDGVPHGGIKRSSGAPNCSYFSNWTSPDDSMTWDVEVHTAGRYEAVVHYSCRTADTGAAIELTCGNPRWEGEIDVPHDPALRGAERDRVPRGAESYVKDFRPLSLGTVTLPAGRNTLSLRATHIPGEGVADVRQIELILRE